jgi:hypothetical protein
MRTPPKSRVTKCSPLNILNLSSFHSLYLLLFALYTIKAPPKISSDAEFFSANKEYLSSIESNSSKENQLAISKENNGISS